MSSFLLGNQRVICKRKKPKETSFKAKTARVPFSDGKAVKELSIPAIMDGYNYNMEAINEFNHLTAQNAGLRHVHRGGHQALKH
jgi:hypothetical protein